MTHDAGHEELIRKKILGDSSEEEERLLAKQAEDCKECRVRVGEFQSLQDSLELQGMERRFQRRALGRVGPAAPTKAPLRFARRLAAVAATLVLALTGWHLLRPDGGGSGLPPVYGSQIRLHAPLGEVEGSTLAFEWSGPGGYDAYQLAVQDEQGAVLLLVPGLTQSRYVPSEAERAGMPRGRKLSWSVRGKNPRPGQPDLEAEPRSFSLR